MKPETVLSGIRATSRLHFGNFIGAVQNFVKFQQPGNTCLYFIADWHSQTTLGDLEEIRNNLIEIVKDYIAAGLDPEQSIIYAQSSVPEIAELSWYLSCLQHPVGKLLRMPSYEEKKGKSATSDNLGLLSYPVLMAADILGPRATLVPVGDDQVIHVELARTLARRFNSHFGSTFVVPEMMEHMIRVPGLDGNKMSKSDADNVIEISSPMEEIRDRYLKRGVTDIERKRASDPGDPYNRCQSVYPVHEFITPGEAETRTIANACKEARIGCVACKNLLVGSIGKILEPFQAKRAELADKDDYIKEVLHEGGKKARGMIRETVEVVRDKMGIVIY